MTALRRVKVGVLVAVATALAASTLGHAASAGAVTEFSGEATAAGLTVTATSQEDGHDFRGGRAGGYRERFFTTRF